MELYDDEIDLNEVDDIIEEIPSDYFSEEEEVSVSNEEETKFTDVIKELKYQLKFNELSRTYVKLKINGKNKRVIPLTEFKKSGSFVLKTDSGSIIQARRSEISK